MKGGPGVCHLCITPTVLAGVLPQFRPSPWRGGHSEVGGLLRFAQQEAGLLLRTSCAKRSFHFGGAVPCVDLHKSPRDPLGGGPGGR